MWKGPEGFIIFSDCAETGLATPTATAPYLRLLPDELIWGSETFGGFVAFPIAMIKHPDNSILWEKGAMLVHCS